MTLLKICGITSLEDLKMCFEEGADIAGFNLYPKSVRYISAEFFRYIAPAAAGKSAVVTVDMELEKLFDIIKRSAAEYIQLHGSEDNDYCIKIKDRFPNVKLIRKVTIDMKDEFNDTLKCSDFILCDVKTHLHGGTGLKFDWELLREIPDGIKTKMFVAGGVTPENVSQLAGIGLAGIDVASGSETSAGIKDRMKIRKMAKIIKERENL